MNSCQITINIMFSFVFLNHNFCMTTAQDAHHDRSPKTRSELLNDQNKYKHVLYTLLSQKYVDAEDHKDRGNNADKAIENDKDPERMEHYNFVVDYLKRIIKEINDKLLNLDEEQWDTKCDSIMNIYKEQVEKRKRFLNENTNFLEKLKNLLDTKKNRANDAKVHLKLSESAKGSNGHLRFKRSPLERRPLKFFDRIFNFDRNRSGELKENERKFATGVYLKGRKPEREEGNVREELAKWQKQQEQEEKEAAVPKKNVLSVGETTIPGNIEVPFRKRRAVNKTEEATRPTLPDFVANFGGDASATKESDRKVGTHESSTVKDKSATVRDGSAAVKDEAGTDFDFVIPYTGSTKGDQFDNLLHIKDNRDPAKYTFRLNKFNPHPSAEYFMDKVDNWVSWAKREITRLSALPTTPPLSTLDYHYSKASVSRFFSLNPRYLQSTNEDGLNKWGGRQYLPRSQEDFTFDLNHWDQLNVTERSEEARSFATWQQAVNWSREPSSRPSTHPYFEVDVDQCINKIFKCVSCKTYETKELTRYIDHLYEHYLHNSLMIPSFEDILTELRRREKITGSETWRREF